MSAFARAAELGGAGGIRANGRRISAPFARCAHCLSLGSISGARPPGRFISPPPWLSARSVRAGRGRYYRDRRDPPPSPRRSQPGGADRSHSYRAGLRRDGRYRFSCRRHRRQLRAGQTSSRRPSRGIPSTTRPGLVRTWSCYVTWCRP